MISASGERPWYGASAMPMLQPTRSVPSSRRIGTHSSARSFSATMRTCSMRPRPGSTTMNSSPPQRAAKPARGRLSRKPLGDHAQHRVAGQVAVLVVDFLELVEVEEQQRQLDPCGRGALIGSSSSTRCSLMPLRLGSSVSGSVTAWRARSSERFSRSAVRWSTGLHLAGARLRLAHRGLGRCALQRPHGLGELEFEQADALGVLGLGARRAAALHRRRCAWPAADGRW